MANIPIVNCVDKSQKEIVVNSINYLVINSLGIKNDKIFAPDKNLKNELTQFLQHIIDINITYLIISSRKTKQYLLNYQLKYYSLLC